MYRYIAKRIALVIPTLLGAAVLVFALMRLIPGDICVVRLGSGGSTFDPRAIATCHHEIGLDKPLYVQFLEFVWGFCHFDFGISMWSGKPVADGNRRAPADLAGDRVARHRRRRSPSPSRSAPSRR